MNNTKSKLDPTVIAASFVAGAVTILLLNRRARQKTGAWANEMREELARRISEVNEITQEKYNQIIDEMRPRYEAIKGTSSREMAEFVDELKSHWKTISQEAKRQINPKSKTERPTS